MYGILFDHIRDHVPRLHHLHLQELLLPLSIEACFIALEEPNGEVENVTSNSKLYTYQTELFLRDGTKIEDLTVWLPKFGPPTFTSLRANIATSITKITDTKTGKVVSAYVSDKLLSTIIRLSLLRKNTDNVNPMVMSILVQNIHVLKQHTEDLNAACAILQSMFGGKWTIKEDPFENGGGIGLLQLLPMNQLPFISGDAVKRGMIIAMSQNEFILIEDCKFFEFDLPKGNQNV